MKMNSFSRSLFHYKFRPGLSKLHLSYVRHVHKLLIWVSILYTHVCKVLAAYVLHAAVVFLKKKEEKAVMDI